MVVLLNPTILDLMFIHEDDLDTLIKYYKSGKISDEEIKKLRKPAIKLYKNKPKDVTKRLKLLNKLKEAIGKSKQNTVPIK